MGDRKKRDRVDVVYKYGDGRREHGDDPEFADGRSVRSKILCGKRLGHGVKRAEGGCDGAGAWRFNVRPDESDDVLRASGTERVPVCGELRIQRTGLSAVCDRRRKNGSIGNAE